MAFLSSRFLFRTAIPSRFGGRLKAIDRGIERDGAFYLFTLRLVPVFPFFFVNLVMGLTALPLRISSPSRLTAPTDSTTTSQPRAKMKSPVHSMCMVSVFRAMIADTASVGRNCTTEPVRRSKRSVELMPTRGCRKCEDLIPFVNVCTL